MIAMSGQWCESKIVGSSDESLEHVEKFNAGVFTNLLIAQRQGKTCLPVNLGVSSEHREAFYQFLKKSPEYSKLIVDDIQDDQEDTRQALLEMRQDEWLELKDLLLFDAGVFHPSIIWMAEITSAGCLGGDHLWRDLGLSERTFLGELLNNNFPELAARNTKDMKWKKFFYKQLCERDGGYVCRAPTCEQCAVYNDCFGPED